MSRMRVAVCLVLMLSARAFADQRKPVVPPASPPPPPEVKRMVDAVVGRWSGAMTVTIPGVEPETFGWSMDCRPAALKAGAVCTMDGRASIGDLAQACLAAWDPEGRAVHYMCVTSMGEVHDHRGHWKGEAAVEFEPLVGALQGKPMTETITWAFPDPGRITMRSVVTLQDGASMSFEFAGQRN